MESQRVGHDRLTHTSLHFETIITMFIGYTPIKNKRLKKRKKCRAKSAARVSIIRAMMIRKTTELAIQVCSQISITRNRVPGLTPDLPNQDLQLNKIPEWSVCTLQFEKHGLSCGFPSCLHFRIIWGVSKYRSQGSIPRDSDSNVLRWGSGISVF